MQKIIFAFFLVLGLCFGCKRSETPTLFKTLSADESGIQFQNNLSDTSRFNIIQYLYYYNGAGVGVGDFDHDGFVDIYMVSNTAANQLLLNKGNCRFEDITNQAGVAGSGDWKTGVSIVDINADGWLDIYVSQISDYKGLKGKNQLFINNKNKTFTESAAQYGLDKNGFCQQAAFFDFDKDGDLDAYILRQSIHKADNYKSGDMRLLRDSLAGDMLLRNDNGIFKDVSEKAGVLGSSIGYGLGISVSDLNGDGWPDIYVSNDFHENDYLYYNNQNGTFREAIRESVGHTSMFSMGVDAADINNDLRPDIMTLDMKPDNEVVYKNSVGPDSYDIYRYKKERGFYEQFPRNMLQINTGNVGNNTQFSEIGQQAGVSASDWSWSVLLADFDNDTQKDIFVGNGIARRPNDLDYLKFVSDAQAQVSDAALIQHMPKGDVPNVFYKNMGDARFANALDWSKQQATCTNGSAYADLDNDGDLDLILNNLNQTATVLQNQSRQVNNANFINVSLSNPNNKNTHCIGAKAYVYAQKTMQMQEVSPVRGFLSSVDYSLHFGLGNANKVDSIKIIWDDLSDTTLLQTPVNQCINIQKNTYFNKKSILNFNKNKKNTDVAYLKEIPNALTYRHVENTYYDNTYERLIPYLLSTQSPCIATADLNGDGLDDVYIGGSKDVAKAIFLQHDNGTFGAIDTYNIQQDSLFEDVAATFADIDGDKDLDLYVVSGGNQLVNQFYYQDRLYLNDGKGHFEKSEGRLPKIENNGSCVSAADIDADGDIDFFVGRRSVAGKYGNSPNQYLLINDGKGYFKNEIAARAPSLAQIGMVSHATFADLNADGSPDLTLVGEWMPVTTCMNEKGNLKAKKIENTEGLWSSLNVCDLDGDGDLDILAGNFGENVPFQVSSSPILAIDIKDFDKNETQEAIISYYKGKKSYPLFFRDDLMSQIPSLRKQFLENKSFSNKTYKEVFTAEMRKDATHKMVNTLQTQWFENQGNNAWKAHILPSSIQAAAIFAMQVLDINHDGIQDILAGGNLYEVQPVIGRMDATSGICLIGQADKSFINSNAAQSGFYVKGQVRALQTIRSKKGKLLLVGRNGGAIMMFE